MNLCSKHISFSDSSTVSRMHSCVTSLQVGDQATATAIEFAKVHFSMTSGEVGPSKTEEWKKERRK